MLAVCLFCFFLVSCGLKTYDTKKNDVSEEHDDHFDTEIVAASYGHGLPDWFEEIWVRKFN